MIDPTHKLLPLLKQHLTRNFKFAHASDFANAAEIFQSPILVIIIHWPRIETGDLPAISRLRQLFPYVHFILFARPLKNELGFSLGKIGIDQFIPFDDWETLNREIKNLELSMAFQIEFAEFGICLEQCSRPVQRTLKLLKSDFHELRNVMQISEKLNISASHLQNIFRRETGYTCKQLLNGLKVYYSTWLMQQTSFSLTEISTRIGVVPVNNFHRFFKNITGIVPGEYRKKYQHVDFPALFRRFKKEK